MGDHDFGGSIIDQVPFQGPSAYLEFGCGIFSGCNSLKGFNIEGYLKNRVVGANQQHIQIEPPCVDDFS